MHKPPVGYTCIEQSRNPKSWCHYVNDKHAGINNNLLMNILQIESLIKLAHFLGDCTG